MTKNILDHQLNEEGIFNMILQSSLNDDEMKKDSSKETQGASRNKRAAQANGGCEEADGAKKDICRSIERKSGESSGSAKSARTANNIAQSTASATICGQTIYWIETSNPQSARKRQSIANPGLEDRESK